jgi:hypothetical protein
MTPAAAASPAAFPEPYRSGAGGIRTLAGFRPHDFQSCSLSRSDTAPFLPDGEGGIRTRVRLLDATV